MTPCCDDFKKAVKLIIVGPKYSPPHTLVFHGVRGTMEFTYCPWCGKKIKQKEPEWTAP